MKLYRHLLLVVFVLALPAIYGQDFSNKGKDFWLGYGYHSSMLNAQGGLISTGGSQQMVLYFTSDKNANVTVSVPALNYTQNYTVLKNQVTVSNTLPKTGNQDCRIADTGYFNSGIHVTSDEPIVAYAHIYNASISGASLLFPTNTLGKEYYSINFTQATNTYFGYSYFFIVATEDNTSVEITPSAANKNNRPVGVPFTVTLNTGQIYSVFGSNTNYNISNGQYSYGSDLTGSKVRSISTNGNGSCKKIAVFSGSGKMSLGGATPAIGSADNFIAQAFPAVAWGKRYLTVPTGSQPNNFYRVCVTDPNTEVKLNGAVLPKASLINNFYYQFKNGNTSGTNPPIPNLIESDIPVLVAQYCTTQGQEGNASVNPGGDPEIIYLSPVEQTINNITLYSADKNLILQSYINVVIKNKGINSFTLDGIPKVSSFSPHSQDTSYSYATFLVSSGSHTIFSDTGFNAIAYGFGNAESYGYNAGTNIRDFTQVATFQNPYSRIDSAVTCANTPLKFAIPLSFLPTTIKWDFSAAPNISPNTLIGPLINPNPDTTKSINGQTIRYFSVNSTFSFNKSNSPLLRDTIKLYTTSSTPDGCGGTDQLFSIPVIVNEQPIANFSFVHAGCLADSVKFTEASSAPGGSLVRWLWDFGDGTIADLPTATIVPKVYSNAGNGSFDIKLKVISDIGCISTETSQNIKISTKPVAKFTVPTIACVDDNLVFTDASTIQVGTLAKWVWDLDNGAGPVTNSTNAAQNTKYSSFGTKDVKLLVESSTGCQSDTFRISPQFRVFSYPIPGFVIPEVCLNDASALFTDSTKTADSSTNFTYLWNFNAGTPAFAPAPTIPNGATTKMNPSVTYKAQGNYKVSLTVTSNGCVASKTADFTVNGANPVPLFDVLKPTALCSNDSVRIQNKSTVDFGSVTRLEIFWDASDLTKKTVDETPFVGKVYAYRYADFQSPASKTFTIRLQAFSGNAASCSKSVSQVVTVNASPKVSFVTLPGICNEATARQITETGFDNRVSGTFTYTGTGVSATGLFNPQTAGVGTFPIKYVYTSAKGCADSLTKNITVWPSPVAIWSVDGPYCQQNDLVFKDSSKANFSNIVQWIWNYDDGTAAVTRTSSGTHTRKFAVCQNQ